MPSIALATSGEGPSLRRRWMALPTSSSTLRSSATPSSTNPGAAVKASARPEALRAADGGRSLGTRRLHEPRRCGGALRRVRCGSTDGGGVRRHPRGTLVVNFAASFLVAVIMETSLRTLAIWSTLCLS